MKAPKSHVLAHNAAKVISIKFGKHKHWWIIRSYLFAFYANKFSHCFSSDTLIIHAFKIRANILYLGFYSVNFLCQHKKKQSKNLTISLSPININYSRCSKIPYVSCLPKWQRQTEQTQIRLFLKKQSDQVLPNLLFWQAFCGFHPW